MTAPPDFRVVDDFLARSARQRAIRGVALGAAGGFAAAILLALAMRVAAEHGVRATDWTILGGSAILAIAGAAIGFARAFAARGGIAFDVERRAPHCRNLLITAAELPRGAPEHRYTSSVVARQAANVVRVLEPAALFPIRAPLASAVIAGLFWSIVVARPDIATRGVTVGRRFAGESANGIGRVEVTLVPPAYTRQPSTTLRDPSTIDVLAGSRIRLDVETNARGVAIETAGGSDTMARPDAHGAFSTELRAARSGFISIAPLGGNATPAPRRLIGLTVHDDAPPAVRITAPGRDLVLRRADETLEIAAEASDDFSIALLLLKYTKVSGTDERYTYVDGVVPATITRRGGRAWTAHASWRLADLHLQPGDMVVYRAVATDGRPGAAPVESDAFIAELPGIGSDAAAGFSIDPDMDRAAVSQQMVILETERLLAARPSITVDSFADRAHDIAAEQRKVRAEFVFMLGGEIADAPDAASSMTTLNETAEAAGESDLAAGRNENAGHAALLVAIRAMSRAAAALTTAQVDTALGHERTALTQLERAFSHARIILRALAAPERLDLSRRLSGSLTDATGEQRPVARAVIPASIVGLRSAMTELAALARQPRFSEDDAERAVALGDRLLRVDATSDTLRAAAAALSNASAAMRLRPVAARDDLDLAATALASVLRRASPAASTPTLPSNDLRRMRGTLSDVFRGRAP